MATLRMQLEGAAKQRDSLHRQLQQSVAPQNGLAAFSAQETARQLQALRQELAFKEQEVNKPGLLKWYQTLIQTLTEPVRWPCCSLRA